MFSRNAKEQKKATKTKNAPPPPPPKSKVIIEILILFSMISDSTIYETDSLFSFVRLAKAKQNQGIQNADEVLGTADECEAMIFFSAKIYLLYVLYV